MHVASFNNLEPYFSIYPDNAQLKDLSELHEGHDPLTFCLTFNHEKALAVTTEQWEYLIHNSKLHHNFGINKHSLVLYFKNKKDQCLDLTESQVTHLIEHTKLRVPYRGAWSAAEHYLHNRAKQEIELTNEQFASIIYRSDAAYVGKDGFNLLKSLIASYNEKPFSIPEDIWTHLITNSDLLTAGSKGYTPLLDACACTTELGWTEAQWAYVIKHSNLNHQTTEGKTALMIAMNNSDKINISDNLWDYFIKHSNIKLRDKDTQVAFGYASPEKPKYELFEKLFALYENIDAVSTHDLRKVQSIQSSLDELHGLNEAKNHASYLLNLHKIQSKQKMNAAGHMRLLFVGNQGSGKGLASEHISNLYYALNLTMTADQSQYGNSYFYYKNSDFVADFNEFKGRTIYYKYSPAKDEKDLEPALLGLFNIIGDQSLFILSVEPKDFEEFKFKCPKVYSLFTKTIHFPDYTSSDLVILTEHMASTYNLKLSNECKDTLRAYYDSKILDKHSPFINGYLAKETLIKMMESYSTRVANLDSSAVAAATEALVSTLVEDDISFFNRDEQAQSVEELMAEFDAMVGLGAVKDNLRKLIALNKANQRRGSNIATGLHLVFTGNPGTGKTTIARMVGRIYKTLGLLPKGHVVETDRSGLVSGYIGQTALKTKEAVNKAMGGVLFIDEAYALTTGDSIKNDFGKEAVETLLKLMEDHRKDFAVIVAGYPEEMKNFIEMNPGLKSRFQKTLVFEDYSTDELIDIFEGICKKEGFSFDEEVLVRVRSVLENPDTKTGQNQIGFIHTVESTEKTESKYFGNAREVRTIFENALEKQALRLMGAAEVDLWQLRAEDIVSSEK